QCAGHDLKVLARARRVQEGVGGAPATAVAHRVLVAAGALLLGAVEVVVPAHAAALLRRLDGRLGGEGAGHDVADVEGTAGPVILRWRAAPVLRALEEGEDVGIGPA